MIGNFMYKKCLMICANEAYKCYLEGFPKCFQTHSITCFRYISFSVNHKAGKGCMETSLKPISTSISVDFMDE